MPSRFEKYVTHHTSRRYRRLSVWDYTQSATYFVTLCTQAGARLFGEVRQGRMMLNRLGRIVVAEWKRSEEIRDRVHLDVFVVMPNRPEGDSRSECGVNHVHGIVVDEKIDAGGHPDAPDESDPDGESADDRPTGPVPRSWGAFIAGFKSAATTRINDHREPVLESFRDTPGAAVWQRNLPREIDHR